MSGNRGPATSLARKLRPRPAVYRRITHSVNAVDGGQLGPKAPARRAAILSEVLVTLARTAHASGKLPAIGPRVVGAKVPARVARWPLRWL